MKLKHLCYHICNGTVSHKWSVYDVVISENKITKKKKNLLPLLFVSQVTSRSLVLDTSSHHPMDVGPRCLESRYSNVKGCGDYSSFLCGCITGIEEV